MDLANKARVSALDPSTELCGNELLSNSNLENPARSKEVVLFTGNVLKISRRGTRTHKVLLVSSLALYIFNTEHSNSILSTLSKRFRSGSANLAVIPNRRVALHDIFGFTLSTCTLEFVIHVPLEFDIRLHSERRNDIIRIITDHRSNILGLETIYTPVRSFNLREFTHTRPRITKALAHAQSLLSFGSKEIIPPPFHIVGTVSPLIYVPPSRSLPINSNVVEVKNSVLYTIAHPTDFSSLDPLVLPTSSSLTAAPRSPANPPQTHPPNVSSPFSTTNAPKQPTENQSTVPASEGPTRRVLLDDRELNPLLAAGVVPYVPSLAQHWESTDLHTREMVSRKSRTFNRPMSMLFSKFAPRKSKMDSPRLTSSLAAMGPMNENEYKVTVSPLVPPKFQQHQNRISMNLTQLPTQPYPTSASQSTTQILSQASSPPMHPHTHIRIPMEAPLREEDEDSPSASPPASSPFPFPPLSHAQSTTTEVIAQHSLTPILSPADRLQISAQAHTPLLSPSASPVPTCPSSSFPSESSMTSPSVNSEHPSSASIGMSPMSSANGVLGLATPSTSPIPITHTTLATVGSAMQGASGSTSARDSKRFPRFFLNRASVRYSGSPANLASASGQTYNSGHWASYASSNIRSSLIDGQETILPDSSPSERSGHVQSHSPTPPLLQPAPTFPTSSYSATNASTAQLYVPKAQKIQVTKPHGTPGFSLPRVSTLEPARARSMSVYQSPPISQYLSASAEEKMFSPFTGVRRSMNWSEYGAQDKQNATSQAQPLRQASASLSSSRSTPTGIVDDDYSTARRRTSSISSSSSIDSTSTAESIHFLRAAVDSRAGTRSTRTSFMESAYNSSIHSDSSGKGLSTSSPFASNVPSSSLSASDANEEVSASNEPLDRLPWSTTHPTTLPITASRSHDRLVAGQSLLANTDANTVKIDTPPRRPRSQSFTGFLLSIRVKDDPSSNISEVAKENPIHSALNSPLYQPAPLSEVESLYPDLAADMLLVRQLDSKSVPHDLLQDLSTIVAHGSLNSPPRQSLLSSRPGTKSVSRTGSIAMDLFSPKDANIAGVSAESISNSDGYQSGHISRSPSQVFRDSQAGATSNRASGTTPGESRDKDTNRFSLFRRLSVRNLNLSKYSDTSTSPDVNSSVNAVFPSGTDKAASSMTTNTGTSPTVSSPMSDSLSPTDKSNKAYVPTAHEKQESLVSRAKRAFERTSTAKPLQVHRLFSPIERHPSMHNIPSGDTTTSNSAGTSGDGPTTASVPPVATALTPTPPAPLPLPPPLTPPPGSPSATPFGLATNETRIKVLEAIKKFEKKQKQPTNTDGFIPTPAQLVSFSSTSPTSTVMQTSKPKMARFQSTHFSPHYSADRYGLSIDKFSVRPGPPSAFQSLRNLPRDTSDAESTSLPPASFASVTDPGNSNLLSPPSTSGSAFSPTENGKVASAFSTAPSASATKQATGSEYIPSSNNRDIDIPDSPIRQDDPSTVNSTTIPNDFPKVVAPEAYGAHGVATPYISVTAINERHMQSQTEGSQGKEGQSVQKTDLTSTSIAVGVRDRADDRVTCPTVNTHPSKKSRISKEIHSTSPVKALSAAPLVASPVGDTKTLTSLEHSSVELPSDVRMTLTLSGMAEDLADSTAMLPAGISTPSPASVSTPSSPTSVQDCMPYGSPRTTARSAIRSILPAMSDTSSAYAIYKPPVRLRDFRALHLLGAGSHGKVLLVKHVTTNEILAMKILSKASVVEKDQVDHTIAERAILEHAGPHPFLPRLAYSFQTKRNLYMLSDYCVGGELFHHLRSAGSFSEDLARFYAAEILLGLEHLHALGIVYRDLKPENILLDKDGHVVISDFGLAKVLKHQSGPEAVTHTFCGTPEYLSPEMLQGHPHGPPVDWWAFGVLLYEMVSGHPPWTDENPQVTYVLITQGELTFPEHFSAPLRELLQRLLTRDPKQRLGTPVDFPDVVPSKQYTVSTLSEPSASLVGRTVDETQKRSPIRDHSFFASIDWDKLMRRQVAPPWRPPISKTTIDTSNFNEYYTSEDISQFLTEAERPAASITHEAHPGSSQGDVDADFDGFCFVNTTDIVGQP